MKNFPTWSDPRQTARTAINQCKGSDENRGHARVRVCNTSVCTALACRICLYCDKPVKWRRFPPQETLPRGPSFARVNATYCFSREMEILAAVDEAKAAPLTPSRIGSSSPEPSPALSVEQPAIPAWLWLRCR